MNAFHAEKEKVTVSKESTKNIGRRLTSIPKYLFRPELISGSHYIPVNLEEYFS